MPKATAAAAMRRMSRKPIAPAPVDVNTLKWVGSNASDAANVANGTIGRFVPTIGGQAGELLAGGTGRLGPDGPWVYDTGSKWIVIPGEADMSSPRPVATKTAAKAGTDAQAGLSIDLESEAPEPSQRFEGATRKTPYYVFAGRKPRLADPEPFNKKSYPKNLQLDEGTCSANAVANFLQTYAIEAKVPYGLLLELDPGNIANWMGISDDKGVQLPEDQVSYGNMPKSAAAINHFAKKVGLPVRATWYPPKANYLADIRALKDEVAKGEPTIVAVNDGAVKKVRVPDSQRTRIQKFFKPNEFVEVPVGHQITIDYFTLDPETGKLMVAIRDPGAEEPYLQDEEMFRMRWAKWGYPMLTVRKGGDLR